jgi:cytohesin
MVQLLTAKGANIDAGSRASQMLMYEAASSGRRDLVELLITNGVNVNVQNDRGDSSLYLALRQGHKDVAELLIAQGANVNEKNRDERTVLHEAAYGGCGTAAKLLIERGVDINAKDRNDMTPLHEAATYGHTDVAELLIANGADIYAKTLFGWPPSIPIWDIKDTGKSHLNEDIYLHTKDPNSGFVPLHYALIGGHKEIVELLTAKGAKVNVNAKYMFGRTLLHAAAGHESRKGVELLLALGADVNAKTEDGWTPLDVAFKAGARDVGRLLISASGKLDVRKKMGAYWLKK